MINIKPIGTTAKVKVSKPKVKVIRAKLYLVSCDNPFAFRMFIDLLRVHIPRIITIDYDNIKYNELSKISSVQSYSMHKYLIDKVVKDINNFDDSIYKALIKSINRNTDLKSYIFVRVDNLKTLNKLKRLYKRPNYKTIRIGLSQEISIKQLKMYNKYKFDIKLNYVDRIHLRTQVKQFIKRYIPTIKLIHNK
jgi:hypothetical protein